MKATIDIPDDLYRQVKARSALEGRPVRDVAIELFRRWLGEEPGSANDRPKLSVADLMRDSFGIIDSGVTDLSTNPAYLEDFGRDSLGDR
jgi:hypothetical protein